jgi:osmotically-inducible protein OsmY
MEDRYLRRFVVDELDYDPRVTAAHIGVTVDGGVVTLTGHVGSYAEKMAAERIALNVRGVRAVVDNIEVRNSEDARIGDEDLADRCARAIAWDVTIPSDSVRVKVEKGCVTLSGWVERYDQKAAADRALRRFAGVTDIVNVIGVRPSEIGQATGDRRGASIPA